MCDVFMVDESCIYFRQVGRQLKSSLVDVGDSRRTAVCRGQFESKCTVMCKSTDPLLINSLGKGKIKSPQTYIEDCLEPVVSAIEKQRPTSGTKNMEILHETQNLISKKLFELHEQREHRDNLPSTLLTGLGIF